MRVQVGDVWLYFDVAGMGLVPDGPKMRERPVIVCLHGGPGLDHTMLKASLAPLADVAQLVFLDQRGNGRSEESTPDRWNLNTWIDDARGFCEALGIDRPILLGQSFGGYVALGVAARHPELPAKLIVSSSEAQVRLDRSLDMFERLGGPQAREVALRYFERPSVESREEYAQVCLPLYNPTPLDPDLLARTLLRHEVGLHFRRHEIKRIDLFSEAARIRCPTLILGGELDPITTVADVEELAAAIPNSQLEVFRDAGHGVFRDQPTRALAVIREFVLARGDASATLEAGAV